MFLKFGTKAHKFEERVIWQADRENLFLGLLQFLCSLSFLFLNFVGYKAVKEQIRTLNSGLSDASSEFRTHTISWMFWTAVDQK